MTASQVQACRDRAAALAAADYDHAAEREKNPLGIIAAVFVLVLGSLMAFLIDFWADYQEFVDRQVDWAGYVEASERARRVR